MLCLELGLVERGEEPQISVREKTVCLSFSGPDAILPRAEWLCLRGVKSENQKHRSALHQMGSCFASFFLL